MTQKKNSRDPVIEEIHRTRRQMADKFGGDIAAILDDARKRQVAGGRPLWQGSAPDQAIRPGGESDRSEADDSASAAG